MLAIAVLITGFILNSSTNRTSVPIYTATPIARAIMYLEIFLTQELNTSKFIFEYDLTKFSNNIKYLPC